MSKDIKRAADVVTSLFSALDGNRLREANEFCGNWRALVGDKIAAHSRVVDVDRGVVVVEVDHPGWSQQLSFIKKRVVTDLARAFPALSIRSLAVRVRPENGVEYHRQDEPIGAGIPRVGACGPVDASPCDPYEAGETASADLTPLDASLDDPLQTVLSRLRESIRKGKPRSGRNGAS